MASVWDEWRRLSHLRATGKLSAQEFAQAEATLLEAVPLLEEVKELDRPMQYPTISRQIAIPVAIAALAGLIAFAIPGATDTFAATIGVGVLTVIIWRLYENQPKEDQKEDLAIAVPPQPSGTPETNARKG